MMVADDGDGAMLTKKPRIGVPSLPKTFLESFDFE